MNFLSIDIGTTGCKCQLFSDAGEILEYRFSEYPFLKGDGRNYVNVHKIYECLREMFFSVKEKHEITSVAISSLGESFVLLDEEDNILFYPMLYTDERGEEEAEEIKARFGEDKAFLVTGVSPHSMYSLSKLLYIKTHHPDIFAKAKKVMLMGDYFGYLLTGERVIDYALASRTGAFDIEKMEFSEELLSLFGLSPDLFSTPRRAGSVVGRLKEEWGCDITLVLGSHDQICTALGAGVLSAGEAVDGLGTVECITTVFEKKPTDVEMGRQGYCVVPYATEGNYCTYILNFSCGSIVNWVRKKIMHGYAPEGENFFSYMEKQMKRTPTGILTLPYFSGASTPYQDLSARGVILGLSSESEDYELYQSVLEGTSMEMRFNLDVVREYGLSLSSLVATGGGANSDKWLAIKSDIMRVPVRALRSSEGGLCGLAMLSAVAMGSETDLYCAKERFVCYEKTFIPAPDAPYETQYEKYKKIYPQVKEFY